MKKKICKKCSLEKDIRQFKRKWNSTGRLDHCNKCRSSIKNNPGYIPAPSKKVKCKGCGNIFETNRGQIKYCGSCKGLTNTNIKNYILSSRGIRGMKVRYKDLSKKLIEVKRKQIKLKRLIHEKRDKIPTQNVIR